MWDKRGVAGASSMTGTNTLTIEIGDVNDNVHGPGTQNIHVYNYLGKFYNFFISYFFVSCLYKKPHGCRKQIIMIASCLSPVSSSRGTYHVFFLVIKTPQPFPIRAQCYFLYGIHEFLRLYNVHI